MARDGQLSTKLRRLPTRYEPIARLAQGGMAEVWRADAIFEGGDRHAVAIKRVLGALAGDPLYRSMFEDEARLGMLLRHKNIVRVYDARDIGGTLLMIMELVDGTSLKDVLTRAHARQAPMPLPVALHLVRELARALDYAHVCTDPTGRPLGIIHRDVSPHNILLGRDGAVKLTDFGLADASVHTTAKSTELLGGKLGYLAPELVDQRPATPRIDVFAAGIVLWEMLAGRRLFLGNDDRDTVLKVQACQVPPISTLNSRVPPEVEVFLARVLHRNPDRRMPSAAAMIADLDRLIALLDRAVGADDVALLVGLHCAASRAHTAAELGDVAFLLAQELDAFALAAQGDPDQGARPLDPTDFGNPTQSSVVRPRPR
jgi:serine/threonine-protein kinase